MKNLIKTILKFRKARDWQKFHTPKNLASALAVEAAEVLEIFQWKLDNKLSQKDKEQLAEELADVFYFTLLLAHEAEINLIKATKEKIKLNEKKYPVKKAKGKATKYTKL